MPSGPPDKPRDPVSPPQDSSSSPPPQQQQQQQPAADPQLPRSLGRYDLRWRLGAGGMGTVYIAVQRTDVAGDRLCVVKTIKTAAPAAAARIIDEARTCLQLRHRNICVTYDVVAEGG